MLPKKPKNLLTIKTKKMRLLIQISIAAVMLFSYTANAQDFEKYKGMNDVVSVNINQNMFKLMSQLELESEDQEAQRMIEVINQLNRIQIFTSSNKEIRNSLNKDAQAFMKSNKLQELMSVNSGDGKQVKFYFQPGKTDEMVKQLFMHINDVDESIVIFIDGNVNLAEIGKIAKQFNLPGATSFDELEKNK